MLPWLVGRRDEVAVHKGRHLLLECGPDVRNDLLDRSIRGLGAIVGQRVRLARINLDGIEGFVKRDAERLRGRKEKRQAG